MRLLVCGEYSTPVDAAARGGLCVRFGGTKLRRQRRQGRCGGRQNTDDVLQLI